MIGGGLRKEDVTITVSAKGPLVDVGVCAGRHRFHIPFSPDEAHQFANAIHSAADDAEDYRGGWDV